MKHLLFAALAAASCARDECPQPTPRVLAMQGIGEPCGGNGNCGAGLFCEQVFVVPGHTPPSLTSNACTVTCDGGCPSNGVCATLPAAFDGGPATFQTCLRACAVDADCNAGVSAGTCGDAGVCTRLQCSDTAPCPTGYTCEVPAIVCCPSGAKCGFTGPVPGYCRKD